ncbi:PREDICTED: vomeronasal type-1 receptor 4-like [Galeopterus variegatus]|uniref:Vomeronasal type-1 receptor n=1 Tax=Galeopterus variegatus TaxID=482537 RepID=A0ABM0SC20_GALVR|nr:PREDICTED: vomeronasal type-1 receptor 4-like [Galeopterus variegatus]
MFLNDTVFVFLLLSQICFGFMGNSFLFVLYMYSLLNKSHLKKPIGWIFTQLTLVNVLTIMFVLIPESTHSSGVRHVMDDVGCKAVLYMYRVTRGLSICTTSLLSTFQAITICPNSSRWAWLKFKLSTCIFLSCLFVWIINMLIYINIIGTVGASTNFTMLGQGYCHVYCETRYIGFQDSSSFLSSIVIRDLLFVVLMIWTNIYMVILLYRHHRRTQHLHNTSISSQTSREYKATHTILVLVSLFVFFYCLNNVMTFYLLYRPEKNLRLEKISGILSSCYPTIFPFILMKNNKIFSQFTFPLQRRQLPCLKENRMANLTSSTSFCKRGVSITN